MPLRIGFDMDGVLADFASAYQDVEVRLFGPIAPSRAGDPETEPAEPAATEADEDAEPSAGELRKEARVSRRRRDAVWQAIRELVEAW